MKFRNWLNIEIDIHKRSIIGKEVTIGEQRAFILGAQTSYDESCWHCSDDEIGEGSEEEIHEIETKLYILYEDEPEDCGYDDFDDEMCNDEGKDYNDCEYEELTIRADMLRDNEFEANRSPGLADIKTFIILGKRFESTGMSNGVLFGNGDYKLNRMLQEALESKKIGDSWLDIEKNRIWIVEYTIDEGIYDIDWDDEDFSIEVEFEKPSVFHYVGKTFECSIGILNEPICIPISLPELGQLEVKVYGLHDRFLDEDFPEHENYLMLEYQAPPGIQCNFFQKDYLDGYYSEDGYSGVAGFSIDEANPDHSFEVIDCTRRVIKEPIELELFSYYVHGEEEE